jgi:uncharacterized coiled-coil DUF342 family protein
MDFDHPFIGPEQKLPEPGYPKDYVDDLVKKLEDSRALVRELQSKVDRQRKDNDMKNGQIRQLREEKALLMADLRKARAAQSS